MNLGLKNDEIRLENIQINGMMNLLKSKTNY